MIETRKAETKRALPLEKCLAKTWNNGDIREKGRTVEEHCRIAGAVAEELLARLASVNDGISTILPEYAPLAPLLHDVGKVCPTFQKKIYAALGEDVDFPELNNVQPDLEKNWGKHAAVSMAALRLYGAKDRFCQTAGLHHGGRVTVKPGDCDSFGGEEWAKSRSELIKKLLGDKSLPKLKSRNEMRLLAGFTILADWIASGDIFSDPAQSWRELVNPALDQAGFVFPEVIKGLSFRDIFGFEARPLQQAFYESVTGPGLYILEAPMGVGKTEAALYAAYRMLEAGKTHGVYFALPTQLTSESIHQRLEDFLARIFKVPREAILAHSQAWLRKFREQTIGKNAAPGGEWFEHGRRAILAPFAAGTVDQALMATMRLPWAPLRTMGLAGKVVILDEAHSYDAYTGALLDALVRLLRNMGATVIILSATLTQKRANALAELKERACANAYPLITAIPDNFAPVFINPEKPQDAEVLIKSVSDDNQALEEALKRAEAGQQVVWIENTVASAQKIYKLIAARSGEMDIAAGLIHSRFTGRNRATNESYWVEILGKASADRYEKGRILVGTQVLEQSLDIDADFMLTRMAPADLVLQRAGRLWRHARPNRPGNTSRELWLLAPTLDEALENPAKAFGPSGFVYSSYILARSLEILAGRGKILLPGDMRELLESANAARESEPTEAMQRARMELESLVRKKTGLALESLSANGEIPRDDIFGTRLLEEPAVRILLAISFDAENKKLRLLDDTVINLDSVYGHAKAEMAASLYLNMINTPERLAPPPAPAAILNLLRPLLYEARNGSLRVILINPDGSAKSLHGETFEHINYTKLLGYTYE